MQYNLDVLMHKFNIEKLAGAYILKLLNKIKTHDNSKFTDKEQGLYSDAPEIKQHALLNHHLINDHHPEFYCYGINDDGFDLLSITIMLLDWISHWKSVKLSYAQCKEKFNERCKYFEIKGQLKDKMWRLFENHYNWEEK